jgi:hypothetical protein
LSKTPRMQASASKELPAPGPFQICDLQIDVRVAAYAFKMRRARAALLRVVLIGT